MATAVVMIDGNGDGMVDDGDMRLQVTLLLANAAALEALPLFLDELVPFWLNIILSVTAILFFGE